MKVIKAVTMKIVVLLFVSACTLVVCYRTIGGLAAPMSRCRLTIQLRHKSFPNLSVLRASYASHKTSVGLTIYHVSRILADQRIFPKTKPEEKSYLSPSLTLSFHNLM
jgi:hypothetical protein